MVKISRPQWFLLFFWGGCSVNVRQVASDVPTTKKYPAKVYREVPTSLSVGHLPAAPRRVDEDASKNAGTALCGARTFARLGKYEEAIVLFQQALLLDPFCYRAQVELAEVLLMRGSGTLIESEGREIMDLLHAANQSTDLDVRTLAGRLAPLIDHEWVLTEPREGSGALVPRHHIKN